MHRIQLTLVFILFVSPLLFGQNLPDTLIRKEFNFIQFSNRAALNHAFQAWQSSGNNRFTVLHLGDSHLQNENLPNKSRALAQKLLGDGGIGLIEPFSIVKSYDASFYKSKHSGNWEYAKSYILPPKIPLGVRGMTAKTKEENASFTIQFSTPVSDANNLLTVFSENTETNFKPLIFADSLLVPLIRSEPGIQEYSLPAKFKTLSLKLQKTSDLQQEFTLYGLSLSNANKKGAIWHNAGVGASQYKSVLYEDLYLAQARYLNPDLVIIDSGTNDFLYANKIPANLKSEIERVIAKVLLASPAASIVLTSAQDMTFKGRKITASQEFSDLVKQIAFETNCGFWDWYQISGGPNTMGIWGTNGHSMKDGIHLNGKGSIVKGSLLFSALESTYLRFTKEPELKDIILKTPAILNPLESPKTENKAEIKTVVKLSNKSLKIVVKKGQNLGEIAGRYHLTVSQLKKLNRLTSDKISIGQELRVSKLVY
jgi:LysM repeat protein